MEKQIIRWTYLLGVVCVAAAVLWRAAGLAGVNDQITVGGSLVTYMSFFKGAVLLLLTSIATAQCVASQKG